MDFSLYKDPMIIAYVLVIPLLVIGIAKAISKIKAKKAAAATDPAKNEAGTQS